MSLISNFSYSLVSALEVNFTDGSTNSGGPAINGWSWNFGDGNTSILQNPSHTYSAPGIYGVILEATDGTSTSTRIRYILLVETAGVIPMPIIEMVLMKVPPTLFATQNILNYIQRYQLMLREAPDTEISVELVFDETQWPTLYNVFIAELVVLECIREMAAIYAASGSIINTQLMTESTTVLDPKMKSVKTGPAEAEWYNQYSDVASLTEQYSKYYSTLFGTGNSIMEELQKSVCFIASNLEVYIPTICGMEAAPFINLLPVTPSNIPDATNYFTGNELTNL